MGPHDDQFDHSGSLLPPSAARILCMAKVAHDSVSPPRTHGLPHFFANATLLLVSAGASLPA
jgi:hypothetical protein